MHGVLVAVTGPLTTNDVHVTDINREVLYIFSFTGTDVQINDIVSLSMHFLLMLLDFYCNKGSESY